jgi:hypothetical protein
VTDCAASWQGNRMNAFGICPATIIVSGCHKKPLSYQGRGEYRTLSTMSIQAIQAILIHAIALRPLAKQTR